MWNRKGSNMFFYYSGAFFVAAGIALTLLMRSAAVKEVLDSGVPEIINSRLGFTHITYPLIIGIGLLLFILPLYEKYLMGKIETGGSLRNGLCLCSGIFLIVVGIALSILMDSGSVNEALNHVPDVIKSQMGYARGTYLLMVADGFFLSLLTIFEADW